MLHHFRGSETIPRVGVFARCSLSVFSARRYASAIYAIVMCLPDSLFVISIDALLNTLVLNVETREQRQSIAQRL